MQKHTDSHNIVVVTDMAMFEINLCVAYASCVSFTLVDLKFLVQLSLTP